MNIREAHTPRGEPGTSPYTLNFFNGSGSHDSFGGNKYSDILTADQSAGVFGNTENAGCSRDEGQYGDAGGELLGIELRKRKWHSHRESFSNKPSSASKRAREMDSPYLTPSSGNMSRERSTSRSETLSRSSSAHYESTAVFDTEPEQRIFRKDTASWFEKGKVFEVSPDTSTSITNAGISACPLLVVIYRRDSSITCLPLRRHSSITPRNVEFLKSRIRIHARGRQPFESLPMCPWKPLAIDIEAEPESLDDMWINIEKPHTIENVQHVEVALWGVLDDDSFDTLRQAYLSSQLRNVTSPRDKPQATFLWHLQFIFRRMWAGLLWVFQHKHGAR